MQPADSLPGEYAGLMYYKSPTSDPWTITNDTMYVSSPDTINCIITIIDYINNFGGTPTLYTTYYSCNTPPPPNVYFLFYDNDSLKMIYDNMPAPPPNPNYSRRFYGKRISNKTVGVNEISNSEQIKIYPNPTDGELQITSYDSQITNVEIYNLFGKKVYSQIHNHKSIMLNLNLSIGIYFVQIRTGIKTINKKLIIQK
jgi:hypothetical protein